MFLKAVLRMLQPLYSPVCPSLVLSRALDTMQAAFLQGNPGVFETLGSSGSFIWQELQHGQEEQAELGCFLPPPLIFIQQDLKQTPRLQL